MCPIYTDRYTGFRQDELAIDDGYGRIRLDGSNRLIQVEDQRSWFWIRSEKNDPSGLQVDKNASRRTSLDISVDRPGKVSKGDLAGLDDNPLRFRHR